MAVLNAPARRVPAAVPSGAHRPPAATKNRVLPDAVTAGVIIDGADPAGPGTMSFTSTVPAVVPSVFHSSAPRKPSSAEKRVVPLKNTGDEGFDPFGTSVRWTSEMGSVTPVTR